MLHRIALAVVSEWCQLYPYTQLEMYGFTSVMVGATVSSLIMSVRMLTLPVFRP